MVTQSEMTSSALEISPFANDREERVIFPYISQRQLAWLDMKEGVKKWPIWLMLAYQDIKLRYRRSILGPFWITISMAITVYTMGFLYGHLFHMDLHQYYPFLVAGMLTWGLISASIIELTDTFITYDGLIKQIKLPYSLHVHRVVARNVLIFFHNLMVMIPIYVLFYDGAKINLFSLLLIPSLALIYLNAILFGIILSMIGARYRDISQIIKSLIQVVFFITPILWNPMVLPEAKRHWVYLNPFYSFVELIRAPLIGHSPTLLNWLITLSITLIGGFICLQMLIRYRNRIIYWL